MRERETKQSSDDERRGAKRNNDYSPESEPVMHIYTESEPVVAWPGPTDLSIDGGDEVAGHFEQRLAPIHPLDFRAGVLL